MKEFDFEPLEFVDSFVVFLDVLGFSELVYSDNEDELQKINFYFSIIEVYLGKLKGEIEDINNELRNSEISDDLLLKMDYILISDSIIITIKMLKNNIIDISEETKDNQQLQELYIELQKEYNRYNKACFGRLCEAIVQIQKSLASLGIWVRGAITSGTTHISTNKKQIVGKAYIDAYKLEAKANYPRVILDKESIFDALGIQDEDEFMQSIPYIYNWGNAPFKKSMPLFLDYIYYVAVVCNDENRKLLKKIIENIISGYENSKQKNYHDKFIWLVEYVSNCLERGDESYSNLLYELNYFDKKEQK